jgi:hypothetical protein
MGSHRGLLAMRISASPDRTHVLSVGVSSYDIGDLWRLPAAVEHAITFTEWAKNAGVPPRQIHLFLSERDIDRFSDRLGAVSVQARVATYASFNDFVDRELAKLSGDLLYFYWSGHGSISENSQRILFYQDLTRDVQRHLDLNHFLIRLRSAPHGKFPSQIAYVDACANRFEELGFQASAGRDQPGMRSLQSGIQQIFFLAADSGQQAAAGEFSRHVLDALDTAWKQKAEWPPNPDEIIEEVRHQFRGLQQRPVQITWRTSSADESGIEITSGDLPGSEFVNSVARSKGYSVRSLRRLATIAGQYESLSGEAGEQNRDEVYAHLAFDSGKLASKRKTRLNAQLDLLHIIASAFFWDNQDFLDQEINRIEAEAAEFSTELGRFHLLSSVRSEIVKLPTTIDDLRKLYLATIKPLSEEPARINANTLDEMLDELSQVDSGPERFSFLIEFLLRIVNRYPSDAEKLKTLVHNNANQLLLATIDQRLSREQRFLLSVMINPGLDADPVPATIDAKVLVAGTTIVIKTFPNTSSNTWERVRTVVEDIVRQSRRIVIEEYGRDERDLEVEFLLSDSFFLEAPDEFIIALSKFNNPPLGKLHAVVIRWRERILTPSDFELTPWQEAAAKVDRGKPSVIHWLDREQCNDPSTACRNCKGLVMLRFLPKEELYNVIGAGFPFVAWFRTEPAGGNWEQFVEQFGHWAAQHNFEHLPQKVRTIRQKKTDLGAALTLFWDDPSHCRYWTRGDVIIRGTL